MNYQSLTKNKMQKNLISFMCMACLMVVLFAVTFKITYADSNLIPNSSLENSSPSDTAIPAGWHRGGYGSNTRTLTYPVQGFSGKGATVEITSYTSGDAKWYFDDIPVIPGHQYSFSDEYLSTASSQVLLQYTMTDETKTFKWLNDVPPTNSWTKFQKDFIPPANAKSVTVFHLIHSVGTLSTDEYDIHDLSTTTVSSPQEVSIYSDSLSSGWKNWSWGTTVDLNSSDTVAEGTRSLKIAHTTIWGGLYLHNDAMSTASTSYLSLVMNGGSAGGQVLYLRAYDASGNAKLPVNLTRYLPQTGLKANTWQRINIPWSDLEIATGASFTGFTIQGVTGNIEPTYYIDNIKLVNGSIYGSTSASGIQMLKSFPAIALDTLSSTGIADGHFMRFRVTTGPSGSVGIYQLKFSIATSSFATGGGISWADLNVYSDSSYSQPVSGTYGNSIGRFGSRVNITTNNPVITFTTTAYPLQIPAGTTYYFEMIGPVAGSQTGTLVTTTLRGDSSFDGMKSAPNTLGNFIWSPNTNGFSPITAEDWANSYGIPGLPSSGLTQIRSN